MVNEIETADDDRQISVSKLTYRGMQAVIALGLSGVLALSGWTLITVYSISGRVSSIETKLEADSQVASLSRITTHQEMHIQIAEVQDKISRLEDKLNLALGIKSRR